MAISFTPFFYLLPLLFTVLENVVVKGDPDLTFVSNLCGGEHDVNSLRKDQARRLASGAAQYAPLTGEVCGGTNEEPYLYFRATCSPPASISPADCAACVSYAGEQLVEQNVCDDQWGAQITFASCFLRFETYQIPECPPPAG
ncbi:unnamed protein product [Linum trigynum]|uniref:Gnk2-homologous domain-containing protein n=1 Tax=Linum trigynum TaxID=586398 RepID=A0AAV2GEE6_9ROSI